jgi:hypothetical protein
MKPEVPLKIPSEGWGEAVDAARHANEALAVGGVESLIDHHGPDDAGRADGSSAQQRASISWLE